MESIRHYFPDLTNEKIKQLSLLQDIYSDWNRKINVISRKDIGQLYLRHVLHSLAIARYISFMPDTRILDVGTGGGFPGIPLAILFPHAEFMLVDSVRKKIRVVDAVIHELELKNCTTQTIRAEDLTGTFHFIVCRAVTALPRLIAWIKHLVSGECCNDKPNGLLALKGGDLKEELRIPFETCVVELSDFFTESYFETKKLVHVILGPAPA